MADTTIPPAGLEAMRRLRAGAAALSAEEAAAVVAYVEGMEAALADAQDALVYVHGISAQVSRGIARGFPSSTVLANVQALQRRVFPFAHGIPTGRVAALVVRSREFRMFSRLLTQYLSYAKHPAGIQEAIGEALGHADVADKDAAFLLRHAASKAQETADA